MKKNILFSLLIIYFILVTQKLAHSQFNPFTSCYSNGNTLVVNSYLNTNSNISKNVSGITCNPNSFFVINSNGNIDEHSLIGNTFTYSSTIEIGGGLSLAYCNNLNGGTFSPTFYSNDSSYFPIYFDSTNWINTSINSVAFNCGGSGNYLYYQGLDSGSVFQRKIYKYNGTTLTTIYNRQDKIIGIADLAVDVNGNVWFTTSTDTTNFISDNIVVMSPTGNIIKEFSFIYNCYNAYGSFILNNVYYLGLGSSNPISPNTLLPITFSSDSAIIGTPINMPIGDYYDLESCNQGNPLLVNNENQLTKFNIYPNPNCGQFTINKNGQHIMDKLEIYNVLGEKIHSAINNKQQTTYDIDISHSPKGIYFIKIYYGEKTNTAKIVIQ